MQLTDEMIMKRVRAAVRLAQEKNDAMGIPNIIYDPESRQIYAIHSDGRRDLIEKKPWKGFDRHATTEA